jgi:adenylosuccinate synthase
MPITVVVGGQYGSEGKGKVSYLVARETGAGVAVRVGGPNSGHTVVENGRRTILRQLPTAALLSDVLCVLPAGSYIDVSLLLTEIQALELPPSRLVIDRRACLVTPEAKRIEAEGDLRSRIGSTLSGTGAAVSARVARIDPVMFAEDDPRLAPYLDDAISVLRGIRTERIVIEGTQGIGLSVLHSPEFPFVTSRETSAAGALSETGLSPLDVDEIVLVLRAFPIRVGGHSGELKAETNWETVKRMGSHDHDLTEYTSVTGRVRRVAQFDPEIVRRAIAINAPTTVAMNHLDYVDHESCELGAITERTVAFLEEVESAIGRRIDLLGLGPNSLVERVSLITRASTVAG